MIKELSSNSRIIINSDIDGIISGLLLHNFCNCTIVGFTNSSDKVWLDLTKCSSIYDGVYIDMYVPYENTITIDQHIIAFDENHLNKIKSNKNKINPNIDNKRFLTPSTSYYKKYPFGTCHYIIALLGREAIDISSFDINKRKDNLFFKDLLLRADDAMNTSISKAFYKENAKEWWEWLLKYSNNSAIIDSLISYLYSLDTNKVNLIKSETTKVLIENLKCDRPDGGILQISENNSLLDSTKSYIKYISDFCGLNCFDLNLSLNEYKGQNIRIRLNENQKNELINSNRINGKYVFSYAFVKSIEKLEYFSYTTFDT